MKEFANFDAFAKHIQKVTSIHDEKEFKALNFVGKILEEESKKKIGHLQNGAGPFPSWAELAESTKTDKERKGYVFNADYNPLFRDGELKNSIHHVVNRSMRTLYVGSDSDIGLFQEMGTKRIPARSFLGLTLFKAKNEIQYVMGMFLFNWITDQSAPLKRANNGSI